MKIHKNFRLFITYNPLLAEPNKKLSSGFLNKCLIYSLFPIDDDISTTTLILSNILKKNKKLEKINHELSVKLSEIHSKCKDFLKDSGKTIEKKNFVEEQ